MKEYSHKPYQYDNFFEHYFKHDNLNEIGNSPEPILLEYKSQLPSYINTIISYIVSLTIGEVDEVV